MERSNDVLAVRQQSLVSEAPEYIQLLTEYGKGRAINPQLKRRMNLLVNQEYRIMDICKTLVRVVQEILEACSESEDLSDEALQPLREELQEYMQDLADYNLQRKDNIDEIVAGERESLEKFVALRGQLGTEKAVFAGMSFGAAISLGAAAACPVVLVAGLAVASLFTAGHNEAARKMQSALDQDIQRINAPVQYMEAFKLNMDDSLEALESQGGKVTAGRSARTRRRVELVLEEINTIRRASCLNFHRIAGCETLASGFGLAEAKRLLVVQKEMIKDGIDVEAFRQASA